MTHLDELLSVYLDGETTPAESRRVNLHTASCHRCRSRLQELHSVRSALRGLPMLEMPANLHPVDIKPDRSAPVVRRRSVWVGAAAAVAAGFVVISALFASPPPALEVADVSRQLGARVALDSGISSVNYIIPDVGEGSGNAE